jgi:CBS domain-containing protein
MLVKEIMTAPVITAPVGATPAKVAELLSKHHISAVPIVDDDGAVVGIVSEFDLLSRKGATAGDVMSPSVITVSEETPGDDVRALLVDRRIRRVPVLSGQQLVGVVSRSDMIRLLVMEWVCQVCGEAVHGQGRPDSCPRCHAPGDRFVEQQRPPGD